jgi:hypothetical protein
MRASPEKFPEASSGDSVGSGQQMSTFWEKSFAFASTIGITTLANAEKSLAPHIGAARKNIEAARVKCRSK